MKNEQYDECHVFHSEFFEPYFQPIIDINTGACVGVEVLARLVRSEHATVNYFPESLIGYTEQSEITRVMLIKVIALLKTVSFPNGFKFSFNIPADLFAEDWLSSICDDFFRACNYNLVLILEVTEHNSLLINNHSIQNGLSRLNNKNILIALDDFGTGHSNLFLVKRLPVDILKIPKEFIEQLPNGKIENAIVNSIVNLSQSSNIELIAEGVESAEQSHWLIKKGINLQQGFYFSQPMNSTNISLYLNKKTTPSMKFYNVMPHKSKHENNFKFPLHLLIKCTNKYKLTIREEEVLVLVARGVSINTISKLKHRSYKTVWTHKNNGYKKIGVKNDADFINYLHILASEI